MEMDVKIYKQILGSSDNRYALWANAADKVFSNVYALRKGYLNLKIVSDKNESLDMDIRVVVPEDPRYVYDSVKYIVGVRDYYLTNKVVVDVIAHPNATYHKEIYEVYKQITSQDPNVAPYTIHVSGGKIRIKNDVFEVYDSSAQYGSVMKLSKRSDPKDEIVLSTNAFTAYALEQSGVLKENESTSFQFFMVHPDMSAMAHTDEFIADPKIIADLVIYGGEYAYVYHKEKIDVLGAAFIFPVSHGLVEVVRNPTQ